MGMEKIGAVVLAAGMSRRMGQPKMVMPWGRSTVLGTVLDTLVTSEVKTITVVAGAEREKIEDIIKEHSALAVYNPHYKNGEMLVSLQVGLQHLPEDLEAILMVLGDQPQIQGTTVRAIIEKYKQDKPGIIMPSYNYRRGHPWLIGKLYWKEILALSPPQTLRTFISSHAGDIDYVNVKTPSIIQDLDTPDDYSKYYPPCD